MSASSHPRLIFWPLLAIAAVALFAAVIILRPVIPGDPLLAASLDAIVLWDSLLPRACVAILSGAALGLSGALLQRVLRNPIADPSTLGIAAGAQLALTTAMIYAPALIAFSREGVALAGGLAAVVILLSLSWKRGLEPVSITLSGMMMSLFAAAVSATLVLAQGDYVMSLSIWGAGSLHQQNWNAVWTIAPRLAIGIVAAILLLRPLTLLGLDDRAARSLGVALHSMRFLVLVVAVWLAATVTSEVGIIGFIGLAAPAFARASGARTPAQVLLISPLVGALILWMTDSAVQVLSSGFTDIAPTGAATALIGGPLLLWLLPRLHALQRPRSAQPSAPGSRRVLPLRGLGFLAALLVLLVIVALAIGRDGNGWSVATGQLFSDLLAFRWPRVVAAGSAGAMLAAAGVLMQRMTGNPMASPEILGVSAGGGVGLTGALFLFAFPGPLTMIAAMAVGALLTLTFMLAVSARSGFGPERLLLSGIATGAFCMAILTTVLASGGMRGYTLLIWMTGSTNRIGSPEAWAAFAGAIVLIAPLAFFSRWLDILPLGRKTGQSVGLAISRSRSTLAILAALMAVSSFVVGPLSLIGLIAPHLARLLGFARGRHQLAGAILIGATLLIAADWLSRMVIYPYQIPVGLFAALIGGPYLVWLLNRQPADQN